MEVLEKTVMNLLAHKKASEFTEWVSDCYLFRKESAAVSSNMRHLI